MTEQLNLTSKITQWRLAVLQQKFAKKHYTDGNINTLIARCKVKYDCIMNLWSMKILYCTNFLEQRKAQSFKQNVVLKNLWRHYNVKSVGRAGTLGWGQPGTSLISSLSDTHDLHTPVHSFSTAHVRGWLAPKDHVAGSGRKHDVCQTYTMLPIRQGGIGL